MRKLILTLALVTGLGIASPQEAAAKKVKVTSIEHCDGYDYVKYDDGSYAFFYEDGSYDLYMKRHGK